VLSNLSSLSRNKSSVFLLVLALIVGGVGAQAAGVLNSPSGGYLVCVNSTTKVVTYPGTSSCPKGSKKLLLGAQGAAGTNGLTGAAGLSGRDGTDGKDGKTLWNGVKDPESTWGAPGDMFINSVTKTLFGPKDLTTGWPAGVSMVGPAGAAGATGATGAQGPGGASGGSGPAGATGATGATGTNGTNATLTCAQGGTCVVGNTGPGGGIVFYVQTATAAAPWRYLEAAPNTWSGDVTDPLIPWCNITDAFVPNLLTGSTATIQTANARGAGYSNTQKMLRGCAFGAANAAAAYNGGGKSDWHLPSLDELNQLYEARTTVGGFVEYYYWSSSEGNAFSAWGQYFSNGFQISDAKTSTYYVRPVRAF
jgi:hypothetical protein